MLEVVTGDAVVLDLPVAAYPGRMLALAIDVCVQLMLLIAAGALMAVSQVSVNVDYLAAMWVSILILVFVGYPTIFETLTRGKTLGKLALGLRVVGDDGSPERFRQALVRSLVGLVEIYSIALAPVALLTSMVSAKGKRVGDIFAGTYVLQERMPYRAPLPGGFAEVPPPLAAWARTLQLSGLSDHTADAAGSYLRRYHELAPRARGVLGAELANAVAAQVSPPPPAGTPATAYLAAVLAVRRGHESSAAWPVLAPQPPPPAPQPPPPGLQPPLVPQSSLTPAADTTGAPGAGQGSTLAVTTWPTATGFVPPA